LFNNEIYGLTKGQYSPTSQTGQGHQVLARSGSVDTPFNPVSLALGCRGHLRRADAWTPTARTCRPRAAAAAEHRGAALVEIYQNCPIFNDGAFDVLRREGAEQRLIALRHGAPIVFGADGERCVVRVGSRLKVASTADVSEADIVVHDALTD
jgi:2-oxoglutarate ferredoxin oxidoreductase subunit beta